MGPGPTLPGAVLTGLGTWGLAPLLDVPSAHEVQHGACGEALPAGAWHRCRGSVCSHGAATRQALRGLLLHKAQGWFGDAKLCLSLTQPKMCRHDLEEVGPAVGDPWHVLPTRLGKTWSLLAHSTLAAAAGLALFTAELRLHGFPFQLLCLEYSPKNTPD